MRNLQLVHVLQAGYHLHEVVMGFLLIFAALEKQYILASMT